MKTVIEKSMYLKAGKQWKYCALEKINNNSKPLEKITQKKRDNYIRREVLSLQISDIKKNDKDFIIFVTLCIQSQLLRCNGTIPWQSQISLSPLNCRYSHGYFRNFIQRLKSSKKKKIQTQVTLLADSTKHSKEK